MSGRNVVLLFVCALAAHTASAGDVNLDGAINLFDFSRFAACDTGPGVPFDCGCAVLDVDEDGDVDRSDFAAFQAGFGACDPYDLQGTSSDIAVCLNGYCDGDPATRALVGEMDLSRLDITGSPNGEYEVYRVGCDRGGEVVASGVLDAFGVATHVLGVGSFESDVVSGLRARVVTDDGECEIFSDVVETESVPTMANDIDVILPAGSFADVRGPFLGRKGNTFRIGNIDFAVTPKTELSGGFTLDDLELGEWLVVDADLNNQGGYNAIEVNREDTEPMVRLSGRVQGLGPSGLVVLGVSFYMNPQTEYFDFETKTPASFDQITLGMAIEVFVPVEAGVPLANEVHLNVPVELEPEPEPEPEEEPEDSPPSPPFCS